MATLLRALRLILKRKLLAMIIGCMTMQMASALPRIASLNLCADSLILELADPSQIASVSWLARDKALSNYAVLAKEFPSNHGHVEELIPFAPELVFTGANTSAIDNALLKRLGFKVIKIRPDLSLRDYEKNLRQVGEAIGRRSRAETLIAAFQNSISTFVNDAERNEKTSAVIFQANGYSPGADSLPGEMLKLAGLRNSDKTNTVGGKFLSLEELVELRPAIVVLASLNSENPSLADLYLSHPILQSSHFTQETKFAWKPKVITVAEKHFNCGSQFIAQSIARMRQAVEEPSE